jgi:hypothetical protein
VISIEIGGTFIVERRPVLSLHGLEERRAGLDREFVEREVVGAEHERARLSSARQSSAVWFGRE